MAETKNNEDEYTTQSIKKDSLKEMRTFGNAGESFEDLIQRALVLFRASKK